MNYTELSYVDVALAASLIAVNAAISIAMRLGLEQRMIVAAVRMVVQLSLVGLVLKALFAAASPWFTALAMVVMVAFAGREAMARQERKFTGYWSYGIGTGSMMTAAMIVTGFALALLIGVAISMFTAIVVSRGLLVMVAATPLRRFLWLFSPEPLPRRGKGSGRPARPVSERDPS